MKVPQGGTGQSTEQDSSLPALARAAIRAIDHIVRSVKGVREFTDDELCLLRIGKAKSDRHIILSDGTEILDSETTGELHLWNEHVPPIPGDGTYLIWAKRFYSRLLCSTRLLARYMVSQPEWRHIHAWRGESSFMPKGIHAVQLFSRAGSDVIQEDSALRIGQRFADFWDNLYWWMLAWTFNPASLERKKLPKLERWQIWISSARLQEKYGRTPAQQRRRSPN
ncbi:MAG: hypothetical protein AMJ93_03955 [Anaerolineae bacterium SM23_84]|nr:MAG: hypothetical protein AMJ93_03955 [Anaerolineae bacterium SM23_84]